MDQEMEKLNHGSYTYHLFFNHGLYEYIFHLRDFIASIDEHLNEKLLIETEKEAKENSFDPRFNAENQFGIIFPDI